MANAGFSAPIDYFGGENGFAGLQAKSSNDNKSGQFAECPNSFGDTVLSDAYGETIAPNVEYAVINEINGGNDLPMLGEVFSVNLGANNTKKVMVTSITVSTGAGNPASVSISGQQVENSATSKRTYAIPSISLKPRSKAQDFLGVFNASEQFSAFNATFSIDPHINTVAGEPVASDASHARVEVSATLIDGAGNCEIELAPDAVSAGWKLSSPPSESRPDGGYIERTATATKWLEKTSDTDYD